MKVLLVNGSPHKNGGTFTALSEVAKALTQDGIERSSSTLVPAQYMAAPPAGNVL